MKSKLLWGFTYFLIIFMIVFILSFKIYQNNKKVNNQLISYKIIDVIQYTELENGNALTILKANINDHDYEMIINSHYNNVTFKHLGDCLYCKIHKITNYNGFCFSILDGFSIELKQKINNIKENKVKN